MPVWRGSATPAGGQVASAEQVPADAASAARAFCSETGIDPELPVPAEPEPAGPVVVEDMPALASEIFGEALSQAIAYVNLLVGPATVRGLLGPRESTRIWSRHVLNCAVVAGRLKPGDRVVDIGSGAGLPGIPLAIARPDVHVTLLEPLLRRATFLEEAVAELGMTNVTVLRSRAEEVATRVKGTVVTARAVAPLPVLLEWALPLTDVGGAVVALRGLSAADEVKDPSLTALLKRWGGESPVVRTYPGVGDETTTVEVRRRTLGTMGAALAKKAENRARRDARKNWTPKPQR